MNERGPMTSNGVFKIVSELFPDLPPRVRNLRLTLEMGEPALLEITFIPDVATPESVRTSFFLVEREAFPHDA